MSQCMVKVSEFDAVPDNFFGPFENIEIASTFLKEKGWEENYKNKLGVWYVRSSRYSSSTAKIELLSKPEELPKEWPSVSKH